MAIRSKKAALMAYVSNYKDQTEDWLNNTASFFFNNTASDAPADGAVMSLSMTVKMTDCRLTF